MNNAMQGCQMLITEYVLRGDIELARLYACDYARFRDAELNDAEFVSLYLNHENRS